MKLRNTTTGQISFPVAGTTYTFNPGDILDLPDEHEEEIKAQVVVHGSNIEIMTPFTAPSTPYDGSHSFQAVDPDLNVGAAVGSNTPASPKFLAAIMGNILGASLTKVANYLAGVIGMYSLTGVKASRYPSGGVLGGIADGVTDADGAVVAWIDGDSGLTKANAAFKAMAKNSNGGSGFDYGLDLNCPGVDGYSDLAILKAVSRSPKEVCELEGSGVPVDGTTGLNFAGKGSRYVDIATGEWYFNTGTKAATVWKVVTHA